MKKIADGFILVVLCIFLFVGCQNETIQDMNFENIANAIKIEVNHFYFGEETNWIIEDSEAINEAANWLNTFTLNKVSFSEDENPEKNENRESFCFVVYDAQANTTEFCYVIDEIGNCYIRYQSQWYTVENPSMPTFI